MKAYFRVVDVGVDVDVDVYSLVKKCSADVFCLLGL